jgi:hypothetical protein
MPLSPETELLARGATALLTGLGFGLITGSAVGLLFGPRSARLSRAGDVRVGEALAWSWQRALGGAGLGLVAGALASLAAAAVVSPILYGLNALLQESAPLASILLAAPGSILSSFLLIGLAFAPLFGTVGAVGGWLFAGLHRRVLDDRTGPNTGLKLLARNALVAALSLGLAGLLPLALGDVFSRAYLGGIVTATAFGGTPAEGVDFALGEIVSRLTTGQFIVTGLAYSLPIALLGALWYGGLDLVQHFVLRLLLLGSGRTPARLARFLDFAAERILLRKAGSGYLFLHRLLLEYFAALPDSGDGTPVPAPGTPDRPN